MEELRFFASHSRAGYEETMDRILEICDEAMEQLEQPRNIDAFLKWGLWGGLSDEQLEQFDGDTMIPDTLVDH